MRISDWSSDVCSSDLVSQPSLAASLKCRLHGILIPSSEVFNIPTILDILHKKIRERVKVTSPDIRASLKAKGDSKSVVWGKSVSVRVDLGGRRIFKKKNHR